jgi:hypothetical protein
MTFWALDSSSSSWSIIRSLSSSAILENEFKLRSSVTTTSSFSSRTKQRLTWSRHLQLTHASLKCSTTRRHSENERRLKRSLRQTRHESLNVRSHDCIRMTLRYENLWMSIWTEVIQSRKNSTSRFTKISTFNACALCTYNVNCSCFTSKIELWWEVIMTAIITTLYSTIVISSWDWDEMRNRKTRDERNFYKVSEF